MFDEVLIESAGKDRKKGGWISAAVSALIHIAIVAVIIATGVYVKENPDVIEKPMSAFVVTDAAPPPPLPPPPGPVAGARRQAQRVERPPDTQPAPFRQPEDLQVLPDPGPVAEEERAVATEGGVPGGVEGGQIGGTVGGDLRHGQPGGVLNGKPGGVPGGTGTNTNADVPLHVTGNVRPPVVVLRVSPEYTEVARRARIRGAVIIEAVIDRHGNVIDARVLKPLPMGLDLAALHAVRQWKFSPGTLNGQPVPVYFNLTVNFEMN